MVASFRLQPRGTLLGEDELKDLARGSVKKTELGWTWKFDWRAFSYDYAPIWPLLPQIRVPTLIVRGEKSTVLPRQAFELTVKKIAGAEGVEIPSAHHHVPLDSPGELAAAMDRFIKMRQNIPANG
jgi:pimeloyl-ACP methyl ester carboxylesterase